MQAKSIIQSLFVTAVTIFISCSIRKTNGKLTVEDGLKSYTQSSPEIRIQFYGDCEFHPLNKKYFPDADKRFLKYTATSFPAAHAQLMYAAHTIVQPYYSSIGILYERTTLDTSLLNKIKADAKQRLNIFLVNPDTVQTVYGTALRFNYQALNRVTKMRSANWEYLVNQDGNLLRLFFWTLNNDTGMILHETETIVKNINQ